MSRSSRRSGGADYPVSLFLFRHHGLARFQRARGNDGSGIVRRNLFQPARLRAQQPRGGGAAHPRLGSEPTFHFGIPALLRGRRGHHSFAEQDSPAAFAVKRHRSISAAQPHQPLAANFRALLFLDRARLLGFVGSVDRLFRFHRVVFLFAHAGFAFGESTRGPTGVFHSRRRAHVTARGLGFFLALGDSE